MNEDARDPDRPTADAGAETAESAPAPKLPLPKALPIALAAVLLVALAGAGVILAKKQLSKEEAPVAAKAPETTTLDLPDAAAPSARSSSPHAIEGASPNKILNSGAETMKAAGGQIGEGVHSAPGTIDELPPPPAASNNNVLQDSAKEAAKRLSPQNEIDLSAPDAAAAMEKLERAAAAPGDYASASSAAAIDNARLADEVAGLKQALQSDLGRLADNLDEERQRTADQAAEIARLDEELERLRDDGAPGRGEARAALLFDHLAAKARSGAPYRSELDAFKAARPAAIAAALEAYADTGLPTAAALRNSFSGQRDNALDAARRAGAKGPLTRFGANLAALIRLRRSAPMQGASPAAVISRAEGRIEAGDVTAALAELEALTGPARKAFASWIADARAHLAAERALAAASDVLAAALEERIEQ